MAGPLLSSLCTICHVKPHKYRCPRCSTLTCSLPCIKRHKQWAQCNGVRDPTVYIKRADLATPKGIDHDYNYLTSIEREIDHAERDATSRGLVLEEAHTKSKNKQKGESKLETALERCGVIVVKAPKGMTRNKQNDTRVSKKQQDLIWTVEWIQPNGQKALGRCPETEPIGEAYAKHLVLLAAYPEKMKRDEERGGNAKDERVRRKMDELGIPPRLRQESSKPKVDRANSEKQELTNTNENTGMSATTQSLDSITTSTALVLDCPTTQPAPPASVTFHLHHPSLPSKHPVLIPLSPDARLATSLTNRLILEFPTIYVLDRQSDDKLPEGFISEDDFFATAKKELIKELVEGESAGSAMDVVDNDRGRGLEEGEVDQRQLLEVLGKDLKGLTATI